MSTLSCSVMFLSWDCSHLQVLVPAVCAGSGLVRVLISNFMIDCLFMLTFFS